MVTTASVDSGLMPYALGSHSTFVTRGSGKRDISEIHVDPNCYPRLKRSKVPSFTALGGIAGDLSSNKTTKKRVLMIRETLRAVSRPQGSPQLGLALRLTL